VKKDVERGNWKSGCLLWR